VPKPPSFYDRALTRIVRVGAVLGVAGTVFVAVKYGYRNGVGFLAGAGLSILNFHGLRRVVEGLSPDQKAGFRASPLFWALRYFIFFGVGYAIVKLLEISLMPILAGLFVAAAAILVEILFELTHGK